MLIVLISLASAASPILSAPAAERAAEPRAPPAEMIGEGASIAASEEFSWIGSDGDTFDDDAGLAEGDSKSVASSTASSAVLACEAPAATAAAPATASGGKGALEPLGPPLPPPAADDDDWENWE